MPIEPNRVYVLNPCYHLRNDQHRIALFSKVNPDGSTPKEWHTFIHPLQAVMLSFFTHNRRLDENLRLLADFFSRTLGQTEKMVTPYIENSEVLYTVWKEQEIYFPPHILIDRVNAGSDYEFPALSPEEFLCGRLDLASKRFYSGPLMLTLMLTNRCMTNCRYCYADTKTRVKEPLPTLRILELVREAAALQVRQVNLIGGEVFLHNDWDIILKELVRLKIAPEYLSTKIPLTREIVERIRETGFRNIIQVSLDSIDPDILHPLLHVRTGYGTAMMEGLRLLDRSGLNYQVSSVLTRYNCNRHVLTGLYRFLSTLSNLRDWRIVPVHNSLTANKEKFPLLKPTRKELTEIFEYMEEFIIPAAGFPIILGKREANRDSLPKKRDFCDTPCSALNTHMFILPDGKVTICEQLYWNPRFLIGDVNRSGIAEVWNSPRALHLSRLTREEVQPKSNCKTCSLFEKCFNADKRCWSDILKAYGDECWDFPDPRCIFAPETRNKLGY